MDHLKETISILGVTGSVGRSTADVVLAHPDRFDVVGVTAHKNVEDLAELAIQLSAQYACIADVSLYEALKTRLDGHDITALAGPEALVEVAAMPVDRVMAAIVGMAGLPSVMAAIKQGAKVAIANKEPLVAAGHLVVKAACDSGAVILPVDSEHNAIFQVFELENKAEISKIILTASGGPFRTWTKQQMAQATPEQAIAHPNWSMGQKISVDSASMMNKALEVIEAHYLFGMPADKIEVVVHPQSIIHSMVEYTDGSVLSQLGAPDMRTPITNALAWPKRLETPGQRLNWKQLSRLDFEEPDFDRFPLISKAYDCLKSGPASCVAFNAANEVAVDLFLNEEIGFDAIEQIVSCALDEQQSVSLSTIEHVIELDRAVRERAKSYMMQKIA